jgi:guanine deaminase
MMDEPWMRQAIERTLAGIAAGQSPFGAVIVREGRLVAAGHNEVWLTTDPTAHAEVVAIRRAAAALRTVDLSGCEIFTTCEPCPMCASAIHWSRLDAVHFGATIADAQRAGFNELAVAIEDLYRGGGSAVRVRRGVLAAECRALFDRWKEASGRAY